MYKRDLEVGFLYTFYRNKRGGSILIYIVLFIFLFFRKYNFICSIRDLGALKYNAHARQFKMYKCILKDDLCTDTVEGGVLNISYDILLFFRPYSF